MLNSDKNVQKFDESMKEVKRIILTSKNFNNSEDFKKTSIPWIFIISTITLVLCLIYIFFYQK